VLQIAVPAPIFRDTDGGIDHDLNARYAKRLGSTWMPHFVIAGPMGLGEACTSEQRAELVQLWTRHVEPERLIVACWTADETRMVTAHGVRALAMLAEDTDDDLLTALRALPPSAVAYTNPRYGRSLITPALLAANRDRTGLPHALKFSKVTIDELAEVRQLVGPDVAIIHGSSRRIADSLAAGVDIVVSAPLAALPDQWPAPTVASVQRAVDELQSILDRLADHWARVAEIDDRARDRLSRT
jgi:dihydrodipicolinate synthase/N-acetylneuraminate lyase